MVRKRIDVPSHISKKRTKLPTRLEDCEPGATRKEVLRFIEKVATSPKPSQKRVEPPDSASS